MASVLFTAPRHLEPDEVMTWAPGVLFFANIPRRLMIGEYIYVTNRNQILYRAKYIRPEVGNKITTEGVNRGFGCMLRIGPSERPPRQISMRGHTGFSYIEPDLW